MPTAVVVGSGASGVHFAQTLLEKGWRVRMIDAGHPKPPPVSPAEDLNGLKRTLDDPVSYFLGRKYESLILPGFNAEYYGFPPHKKYIFAQPENFAFNARGFAPLFSFAQGGLAEAWTGGCYPFGREELRAFPFPAEQMWHYYGRVARRIGVGGTEDCMARFFPLHDGLMEPVELDEHSRVLLERYRSRRQALNRQGCYMGRSRVAVLSRDLGSRKACCLGGRCLWGCPTGSLYTPSLTLAECRAHPAFEYKPGYLASHFRFDTGARVTKLVVEPIGGGPAEEVETETLVLAAGTLSTAHIFLESIRRDSGEVRTLTGLMDNRQVLMPFVNLRMIGRPFNPKSYQYHQIAIGVESPDPLGYVHGLVTTLKTALIHPVVQTLPLDLGGAVRMFRELHAALGLVNINFSDSRREDSYVTLDRGRLIIQYTPTAEEKEKLHAACSRFRSLLWKLGCVAPPGMTHQRPMGASVHYSGLIPMTRDSAPLTCSPLGQSHDFHNLYFADGITFPELPSKNLTFTLMANATRMADLAF